MPACTSTLFAPRLPLLPVYSDFAYAVQPMSPAGDNTWIFGYGSLMWRPDFEYAESRPAWIEGWARRFWQGSTDHRGIPEAPGRVVTLIRVPKARSWGIAYALEKKIAPAVLDRLDFREQGGYERLETPIYSHKAEPVHGLLYVAGPGNRNYLGEATVPEIAKQAMHATGPSGHNADYVRRLADAIRDLGTSDDHVFDVEIEMNRLIMARSPTSDFRNQNTIQHSEVLRAACSGSVDHGPDARATQDTCFHLTDPFDMLDEIR